MHNEQREMARYRFKNFARLLKPHYFLHSNSVTLSIENNLLLRRQPPLAFLVIHRPEARNALTAAMWTQLARAMNALSDDSEIRVVILTGAGDKVFIAGADIGELKTMLDDPANEKENYRFTLEAL